MNISTTARHCELDEDVRAFAQQRLEKLGRFASDILEVHLIVTAEKFRHSAEITLRLKGHEIVVGEQADQPRVAIEMAADRIEHQVRRFKERRAGRKKGDRTRTGDGAMMFGTPGEESEGAADVAPEE